MEETPCEINGVTWTSMYIPRSNQPTVPITFRNMLYWRSFKDKIELFWLWLKDKEKLTFSQYLDKPRKMETEYTFIEMKGEGNPNSIYVEVEILENEEKES